MIYNVIYDYICKIVWCFGGITKQDIKFIPTNVYYY